jgi:hypothetical protein
VAEQACNHEHDAVAAVLNGRWERASDELKQHAEECEICRDVVAVARLLSSEQERARFEARVPAAGQVWWRAAVRARLEAAHAAARPMTWLHGIAGACALGLAFAAISVTWPALRGVGARLLTQMLGADSGLGEMAILMTAMLQKSLPLAFVMAACILLAPLALYLALSGDSSR